jgi:hypothetical protein
VSLGLTSEFENAQKKSQISPYSLYCREEVISGTKGVVDFKLPKAKAPSLRPTNP